MVKEVPDSVVAAYVAVAVRMHGGADVGDEVEGPDSGEEIAAGVWRVRDGWGAYYFRDPPRGEAAYVCSKMEDVLVVDVAEKFKSIIDREKIKGLRMGDAAWDAAVLAALGETT